MGDFGVIMAQLGVLAAIALSKISINGAHRLYRSRLWSALDRHRQN